MNTTLFDGLKPLFRGDIDYSPETLKTYSHDASLFEIRPEAVIYPKDSKDVQTAVAWVNKNKAEYPMLSITARSAGTDMSGGSIGAGIIMDFTRYMHLIKEVTEEYGIVEPGCYYRDFEKETLKYKRIMPTYTASREICAVGGMVANNSGGEKSIKYGKTENHIKELKVVFSDAKEYVVKPLTIAELQEKIMVPVILKTACIKNYTNSYRRTTTRSWPQSPTFRKIPPDIISGISMIRKPTHFDLCRLIVGSQGTLGINN